MKNLSVFLSAIAALLIVGCGDNTMSPVSSDGLAQSSSLSRIGETDDGRAGRVEGTVNAVNMQAGTVTIGTTVVRTDASTKIERNGRRVRLSAFVVGDFGQARLIGSSNLASKVEASFVGGHNEEDGGGGNVRRIEGVVNATNPAAGTVTIGAIVVSTNSSTRVERNGMQTTLAAFVVGDFGQARLTGSSGNLASKVEAASGKHIHHLEHESGE
jgi:hypothetical protein